MAKGAADGVAGEPATWSSGAAEERSPKKTKAGTEIIKCFISKEPGLEPARAHWEGEEGGRETECVCAIGNPLSPFSASFLLLDPRLCDVGKIQIHPPKRTPLPNQG